MIVIGRDILADALTTLAVLVSPNDTIPILRHIAVEPLDGAIRVEATNLSQWAAVTLECQSDAADGFALEGRRLQSIVSTLGKVDGIRIDAADGFVHIVAGRSRLRLPTIAPGDFPRLAFDGGGASFDIPARILGRALARVAYSHGNEVHRANMCGAYIDQVEGKLRVVATNGRTLAMVDTGCDAHGWAPTLLPSCFTEMLEKRLTGDRPVKMELSAKGNIARVTMGEWMLASKVVDLKFPDYRRILNVEPGQPVDVDCRQLHAAVSRVCLATDLKGVKAIRLDFAPDRISVSHRDAAGREGVDEVPASGSAEGSIGYDSRFLLSTLSGVGETATFEFRGPEGVASIRNPADPGFFALLYPYRI